MNETSQMPESVKKFYKNIDDTGNIYHIYSVNKDGEITQEAFGKNVITDYGLTRRWNYNSASTSNGGKYNSNSYMNLYIGNSTTQPVLSSQSMDGLLISNAAAKIATNDFGQRMDPIFYGIVFHPAKDGKEAYFTQKINAMQYYYDYNISGVSDNLEITEIGMGESSTKLLSHALIYDINGNPSSIIKKPNERLYIDTYWEGAVPVALIDNIYDNGGCAVINPYYFATLCYPLKNFAMSYMAPGTNILNNLAHSNRGFVNQNQALSNILNTTDMHDHIVYSKNVLNSYSLLCEDPHVYVTGICMGDEEGIGIASVLSTSDSSAYRRLWTSSFGGNLPCPTFIIYKPLMLAENERERLEIPDVYTNSFESSSLYYSFGYAHGSMLQGFRNTKDTYYNADEYGAIPAADMEIESITRYNHETKQWDIPETYHNIKDFRYDQSLQHLYAKVKIHDDANDTDIDFRISINPYWNDKTGYHKISSINLSGVTIYATDTYWDYSSYQLIPNLSNVPEELQQKKYYCVKGTSASRFDYSLPSAPNKITGYEAWQLPCNVYNPTTFTVEKRWPLCKTLSSDTNGWILLPLNLIYPDAEGGPKTYPISFPGDKTNESNITKYYRFGNDDRVVLMSDSYVKNSLIRYADIRVYKISSDPNVAPEAVDLRLPFTNLPSLTSDNSESKYRQIWSWAESEGLLCAQQYGYNEAVIVNTYDLENPFRLIQNCRLAHISNISNYVVYQCTDITNVCRFKVIDGKTGEEVDTFELPDDRTYVVNGILGWKQYVYIYVTFNGTDDIIKYNINLHTMQFNESAWNVLYTNLYDYNTYHYESSNNECYIISNGSNSSSDNFNSSYGKRGSICFIDGNDPMTLSHLWNSDRSGDYRMPFACGTLKYIDDGKNLIYAAKETYDNDDISRYYIFDIGRRIDEGSPLMVVPWRHFPNMTYTAYGLYKNYIFLTGKTPATDNLHFVPIEYSMGHKVVGTTRTITAYNNPFRISGIHGQFAMSNDMNNVYNYQDSLNEFQY